MAIDCSKSNVNSMRSDYTWNADLKNEGTQRLSMWEAAHVGETYTSGIIQEYKTLTDDAVRREQKFRAVGYVYRSILNLYSDCYTPDFIQAEISMIDQNDGISTSDQNKEIENYQIVERAYITQQQAQQLAASIEEQTKKMTQQGIILRDDYNRKIVLKNEGTARLDAWYQYNTGGIITASSIQNLKHILDDSLKRELDFRTSANTYKDFLNQHSSIYDPSSLSLTLSGIDTSIAISTSDQNTEITQYQETEKRYLAQENIIKEVTGASLLVVGLGIATFVYLRHRKTVKGTH